MRSQTEFSKVWLIQVNMVYTAEEYLAQRYGTWYQLKLKTSKYFKKKIRKRVLKITTANFVCYAFKNTGYINAI